MRLKAGSLFRLFFRLWIAFIVITCDFVKSLQGTKDAKNEVYLGGSSSQRIFHYNHGLYPLLPVIKSYVSNPASFNEINETKGISFGKIRNAQTVEESNYLLQNEHKILDKRLSSTLYKTTTGKNWEQVKEWETVNEQRKRIFAADYFRKLSIFRHGIPAEGVSHVKGTPERTDSTEKYYISASMAQKGQEIVVQPSQQTTNKPKIIWDLTFHQTQTKYMGQVGHIRPYHERKYLHKNNTRVGFQNNSEKAQAISGSRTTEEQTIKHNSLKLANLMANTVELQELASIEPLRHLQGRQPAARRKRKNSRVVKRGIESYHNTEALPSNDRIKAIVVHKSNTRNVSILSSQSGDFEDVLHNAELLNGSTNSTIETYVKTSPAHYASNAIGGPVQKNLKKAGQLKDTNQLNLTDLLNIHFNDTDGSEKSLQGLFMISDSTTDAAESYDSNLAEILNVTWQKNKEKLFDKEELIRQFKLKYPVKVWKTLGMLQDKYLEHIDVHWLKYDPPNPLVHKMYAILYGIFMIVGCSGNFLVIFMFARCRSLRTPPNYLIANLAVSDFFMMAKTPIYIINSLYQGPVLGQLGCSVYGFVGGLTGTTSIMTLASIALDRYYAIVHPLNPFKRTTSRRAVLMILSIWLYSALFASLPLFGVNNYTSEGYLTSCSFDYLSENLQNRIFVFVFFLAAWLLPLVVIMFSYFNIFRIVHAAERMETFTVGNVGHSTGESFKFKSDIPRQKSEVKIALLAAILISLWMIAWTPYALVALMGIFGGKELLTPFVSAVPSIFCKTSSCINPFVYSINHPKFQRELQSCFTHKHNKRRGTLEASYYSAVTCRENSIRCISSSLQASQRHLSLKTRSSLVNLDGEKAKTCWEPNQKEIQIKARLHASKILKSGLSIDSGKNIILTNCQLHNDISNDCINDSADIAVQSSTTEKIILGTSRSDVRNTAETEHISMEKF